MVLLGSLPKILGAKAQQSLFVEILVKNLQSWSKVMVHLAFFDNLYYYSCLCFKHYLSSEKPKVKLYKDQDGNLKGDGRCCYLKVPTSPIPSSAPNVYKQALLPKSIYIFKNLGEKNN